MTATGASAILARAVAPATDVIGGVRPDHLDDDVRALLGRLVNVLHRMARRGSVDVADDGWLEAWCDAAALLGSAGPRPAELTVHLNQITVLTWDLAEATGQRPAWDPEVLALAYDAARYLPGAGAVPLPDDAPLIDRLAALNGRSVLATASCGY
jgi:hypothetical protein